MSEVLREPSIHLVPVRKPRKSIALGFAQCVPLILGEGGDGGAVQFAFAFADLRGDCPVTCGFAPVRGGFSTIAA